MLEKKPLPKDLPLAVQAELLLHPEKNSTAYVPFERATEFTFEPDAHVLSRVNAWWLADASWLAYNHDPDAVRQLLRDNAGLACCRPISSGGTQCYVASGKAFAIVAFRGTQPDDWRDLFDIARFEPTAWDVGHVHKGFAAALDVVRNDLDAALAALPAGCRVWFTGHSLGAALATLAAYRYRAVTAGVYTCASPLVGTGRFARQVDAVFGGRSLRYVNNDDVVPHVPPALLGIPYGLYTHVECLRWIGPDGSIGPVQPPGPGSNEDLIALALTIRRIAAGEASIDIPPALAAHTPLYYTLHCWNDFATHGRGPCVGPCDA
jgi:hypothetical protein